MPHQPIPSRPAARQGPQPSCGPSAPPWGQTHPQLCVGSPHTWRPGVRQVGGGRDRTGGTVGFFT